LLFGVLKVRILVTILSLPAGALSASSELSIASLALLVPIITLESGVYLIELTLSAVVVI
jgi:hypothetical protein